MRNGESLARAGAAPLCATPEGGFVFTTSPGDGISGATWPVSALVGVFQDNSLPTSTPAPADLELGPSGMGTIRERAGTEPARFVFERGNERRATRRADRAEATVITGLSLHGSDHRQ
jgi:hypothetical protein